jgi:hypothetical protein
MLRHGGGVVARRPDQLPAPQELERRLHGAFGEACFFGQHAQTGGDRFPSLPRRPAVKVKVNEIRRRLPIVPNDVAHQDVEDVVIDRDRFAKSRHPKSKKEELRIRKLKLPFSIPINGQRLSRTNRNQIRQSRFDEVRFFLGSSSPRRCLRARSTVWKAITKGLRSFCG